jgi:hypothetical protein
MKYHIKIKHTGELEFFPCLPPGMDLPSVERRFSEIVPLVKGKRRWFRILRFIFGERGRVADWTRTWRGLWHCTILMGPHRGASKVDVNRQALVKWEQGVWLNTAPAGSEMDLVEVKTK